MPCSPTSKPHPPTMRMKIIFTPRAAVTRERARGVHKADQGDRIGGRVGVHLALPHRTSPHTAPIHPRPPHLTSPHSAPLLFSPPHLTPPHCTHKAHTKVVHLCIYMHIHIHIHIRTPMRAPLGNHWVSDLQHLSADHQAYCTLARTYIRSVECSNPPVRPH